MSKQDGYASRTAADLERKYNFGKTFSEVYGLVSDARKMAEEAQNAYEGLTQNEIFNLLTDFGKSQGVYRDDTGNVYVNASYIKGGKIAAELIDVQSLKVSGNLATQDDIPDTSGFATMDDIPDISGFIKNDLSDPAFANKTGITQIMGGVITTDFLKTLGIFSEVAYINGKLTVGQLPDDAATKDDIPDTSGFATKDDIPDTSKFIVNNVPDTSTIEYSKMTGITEIIGGVVTADYVQALGVIATSLVSTGSERENFVIISDGRIVLSSGQIKDGISSGIGDILEINANSVLRFNSGDTAEPFIFTFADGSHWTLGPYGMQYYNQYGEFIREFAFNW